MNPSNRGIFAALAAALISFFRTFTRSMTVLDDAVGMAEESVKEARKRQTIDLGIEMNDYATQVRERNVMKQVRQELSMREFIGDNEEKKQLVAAARAKIDAIITKRLSDLEVKPD